mgnify:CR=1 FL=1
MENKISDVLRKQDENERLNEMFANAVGSEDAALREEHIKVFNLGGNRHQAVIYPEPVHFRDPKTGKWQDIDNTLEETITKYLSNGMTANLFDVRGYDYSVFEQIPPGLISVNWSGDFGVDLYIFLKRKEAAW